MAVLRNKVPQLQAYLCSQGSYTCAQFVRLQESMVLKACSYLISGQNEDAIKLLSKLVNLFIIIVTIIVHKYFVHRKCREIIMLYFIACGFYMCTLCAQFVSAKEFKMVAVLMGDCKKSFVQIVFL